MIKHLPFKIFFTLFVCLLFTTESFAGWPTFKVLSPRQILSDLVITHGCPEGEGFIPEDSKIKINNYYIPHNETWYWQYTGDDKCQRLPTDLQYIAFHQTGHYTGDLINIFYGSNNNELFRFTFTIPGPYWYCGYFAGPNPPETIGCAQDQSI